MQRTTFRHLDREWEATLQDSPGDHRRVLFRNADEDDPKTYEARIHADELSGLEEEDEDSALRRGLESALILDALEGHEAGLTAEELARMTGMPTEAAEDRVDVLDRVQPVLQTSGPRRYRTLERGGE